MYHTMSLAELIKLRSYFQWLHCLALRSGNVVRKWRALNTLRVINAEIHVAVAEGRF